MSLWNDTQARCGEGETGCTDEDLGMMPEGWNSAHFTDGGIEALGRTKTVRKNLEERD